MGEDNTPIYQLIEKSLEELGFNNCETSHRDFVHDGIHCHYQKLLGSDYIALDYYRYGDNPVFKLAGGKIKVHSRDHLKSIIKMFI